MAPSQGVVRKMQERGQKVAARVRQVLAAATEKMSRSADDAVQSLQSFLRELVPSLVRLAANNGALVAAAELLDLR